LILGLLAAFAALAKVNYLFLCAFTAGLITYDLVLRKERRVALILATAFLGFFVSGWMLAGQNPLHLGSFFLNGFAIVQSYNESLSLEGFQLIRQIGFGLTLLLFLLIVLR